MERLGSSTFYLRRRHKKKKNKKKKLCGPVLCIPGRTKSDIGRMQVGLDGIRSHVDLCLPALGRGVLQIMHCSPPITGTFA